MWLQEISLIYEDSRGLYDRQSAQRKDLQAPQLSKPNLSIRNVKLGTPEPNMAASSLAGNVMFGNPMEQEEEIHDGPISKLKLLNLIDQLTSGLDSSSPTDRVALMVLGKLKREIAKS